ncbi:MarR family transcriptional regulator [Brevibacillus fluminis]|uniref:MarR family transcriptional regulator n=2 Tax=Brevibacillus fluminis TaxID=511487 RepID=A0A3M8DU19_9BACL|nr:MarR family transcriptional regulator [Brevibacillus fluminis]
MNAMDEKIDRLQTAIAISMKRLGHDMLEESEIGLTRPQYFILRILDKEGKCMGSELAQMLQVKPSAITVMIERLHKQGYVERLRHEQDRRVVFIALTDKGRMTLHTTDQKRKEILSCYLSQLDESELDALVRTHEKLADIVLAKK